MDEELTVSVRAAAFLWAAGAGLVVTGTLLNLLGKLPPRPDRDGSLGGIHDRVARRCGPPTSRIGLALLGVATPLLALALWLS